MNPETIVAAAIKSGGAVYSVPKPGRHGEVFLHMMALGLTVKRDRTGEVQGFLTSTGRFVNRKEAAQIAISSGQALRTPIKVAGIGLFSEDVW